MGNLVTRGRDSRGDQETREAATGVWPRSCASLAGKTAWWMASAPRTMVFHLSKGHSFVWPDARVLDMAAERRHQAWH